MPDGGGPARIQLLDVRNQTFEDAARTLRDAKLQVARQDVDADATAGIVVNTNPRPGTQVSEGQLVTLQVSTGRTALPDVTGKTDAEATAILNQAGWSNLRRGTQIPDRDFEPGEVFRTDPTAGTSVPKDRTITLYIAEAKPTPSPTPSPTPTTPSPTESPQASASATPGGPPRTSPKTP